MTQSKGSRKETKGRRGTEETEGDRETTETKRSRGQQSIASSLRSHGLLGPMVPITPYHTTPTPCDFVIL